MLRHYHVFISHAWDYDVHYQKLKDWLSEAAYFTWSDYSVPIEKPIDVKGVNNLKEKLRNRIASSSCVIILSGMYASYSNWINYELNVAKELKKPIIGVKPWGQEKIPKKVLDNADVMVGWNSKTIVDAVRKYSL